MRYLFSFFLLLPFLGNCQDVFWAEDKINVISGNEITTILNTSKVYQDGWADLSHPNFWKKIMQLSPDSCLINIADTREVVCKMSIDEWNRQSDHEKSEYRDSVRKAHSLDAASRIYVTTGKRDFYKFDLVYPTLTKGLEAFEKNNVDPWYAQAILLIESPGQLKKSRAGAYGPFQLMPGVARAQGLTVNRYTDERSDFERSAFGASQLIKNVCIPEAKKILDAHHLDYDESELWFRLFVLHVYHAGAANVNAVVSKINPEKGDKDLIQKMWITSAANFGNNSQNYTQLALASQLILHDLVHEKCDYIQDCAQNLSQPE